MNNTKRIEWIDELKGFIIILVCMGHVHINSTAISTFIAISSAFRMVTFFFLSGFLFSTRRHKEFNSYCKSKINSLLLPYIYLSLFCMLLDPRLYNIDYIAYDTLINYKLFELCNITFPIENSCDYLMVNLYQIFFIGGSSTTSGPLWFVLVLFIVSILFYITHKILKVHKWGGLSIAIVCLILGWMANVYSFELPFKLAPVFTAYFFYSIGYLAKPYMHLLINRSGLSIIITVMASFILYMYFINQNGAIALWNNILGHSFIYYILSTTTGIFFIINAFILFDKYCTNKVCAVIKGIFKNIARNALIILAIHYLIIRLCNIFLHDYQDIIGFTYLTLLINIIGCNIAIPIFRNKLYWIIGKEKVSIKESLSIQ